MAEKEMKQMPGLEVKNTCGIRSSLVWLDTRAKESGVFPEGQR